MEQNDSNKRNFIISLKIVLPAAFNLFGLISNRSCGWYVIILVITSIMLVIDIKAKKVNRMGIMLIALIIVFSMGCISYDYYYNSYNKNKLPETVDTYELQLNFKEVEFKYWDDSETKNVLLPISSELDIEYIKLEAFDYDVIIDDTKMDGNTMIVSGVPSGNIGISIKFKGYDQYSANVKFNKKDLEDDKWEKDIYIEKECDYEQYEVSFIDQAGNSFGNSWVDLWVNDDNVNSLRFVTDKSGKIPYTFSCPTNDVMKAVLHIDNEQYEMSVDLKDQSEKITFMCSDAKSPITIQLEEQAEKEAKAEKEDDDNTEQQDAKQQDEQQQDVEQENITPVKMLEEYGDSGFDIIQSASVYEQWDAYCVDSNTKNENKINLDEKSAICIKFSHDNLTEDISGWNIALRNSDGETIVSFQSKFNKEDTYSDIVGLESGTYYLTVDCSNFSDAVYHVQILKSIELDFEVEMNDTILNADSIGELATGEVKTKYGTISRDNDIDYYKFQTNDNGVMALDFRHLNYTDDKTGWIIKLWDSDMNNLYEFESKWINTQKSSPNIGIPKGEYYISVEARSFINENPYSINIVWSADGNWEAEFNDEILNASETVIDRYSYGSTMWDDDVDYYKFQCNSTGVYSISFEHDPVFEDKIAWMIHILDEEGNDILSEDGSIKLSQSLAKKNVTLTKDKTYYIKIESYNNLSTLDYKIKLTPN